MIVAHNPYAEVSRQFVEANPTLEVLTISEAVELGIDKIAAGPSLLVHVPAFDLDAAAAGDPDLVPFDNIGTDPGDEFETEQAARNAGKFVVKDSGVVEEHLRTVDYRRWHADGDADSVREYADVSEVFAEQRRYKRFAENYPPGEASKPEDREADRAPTRITVGGGRNPVPDAVRGDLAAPPAPSN